MSHNIEGLPPGTRILRVRMMNSTPTDKGAASVELEPDNVYGVLDLRALKLPYGYAGFNNLLFDAPGEHEYWLHRDGSACCGRIIEPCEDSRRLIIRKVRRVLVLEYDDPTDNQIAEYMNVNGTHWRARVEDRKESACIKHEWKICNSGEEMCRHCNAVRQRPERELVECDECRKKPGSPPLCADCLRRRDAIECPHRASEPTLHDFRMFCEAHPELRFWQALAAWSGARTIEYVVHGVYGEHPTQIRQDTFHWKGLNG